MSYDVYCKALKAPRVMSILVVKWSIDNEK